jgi:hypothetical protein
MIPVTVLIIILLENFSPCLLNTKKVPTPHLEKYSCP